MLRENQVSKLWKTHNPGDRIAPPKSGKKDKQWQLRLDAGEVKNGKKRVYLQVNSQAFNEQLKKWVKKHSTDGNLAFGDIDVNEKEESIPQAFEEFWTGVAKEAKENLG
jgi:hypothetical protein